MSEPTDVENRVHDGLLALARILGRTAARQEIVRVQRLQAEPQPISVTHDHAFRINDAEAAVAILDAGAASALRDAHGASVSAADGEQHLL